LDDYNESREKEDNNAQNSGEKDDEIEEGSHLKEDEYEDARELHGTGEPEPMEECTVITQPENEIDEDSERCCSQGGYGTGIGRLSDGA
jgi:hypothetical protein